MNAVFGMDQFFVRRRIFEQTLAGTSGDRLISCGNGKGLFGLRVNHPEDFLNVVCHLLEPFFSVELYLLGTLQRSGVEDNQNRENSGPKSKKAENMSSARIRVLKTARATASKTVQRTME